MQSTFHVFLILLLFAFFSFVSFDGKPVRLLNSFLSSPISSYWPGYQMFLAYRLEVTTLRLANKSPFTNLNIVRKHSSALTWLLFSELVSPLVPIHRDTPFESSRLRRIDRTWYRSYKLCSPRRHTVLARACSRPGSWWRLKGSLPPKPYFTVLPPIIRPCEEPLCIMGDHESKMLHPMRFARLT